MSEEMNKKVVVVTGAGSGIGRAAAGLFVEAGATVYGADMDEKGLQHTAELVAKARGTFSLRRADVSNEEDVRSLIALIDSEHGRLDIACNNAGISGPVHRLADYPTEQFDRVLAINLRGNFLSMKYELPLMKRRGGGVICNTSSVAALTGPSGISAYAASKHAIYGLTRSAAHEYARDGIRINAIAPGRTDTPMVVQAAKDNPAFADEVDELPVGRAAEPIEIARAIFWLCSPASSYVYGHMLVVDGGNTIGGPGWVKAATTAP